MKQKRHLRILIICCFFSLALPFLINIRFVEFWAQCSTWNDDGNNMECHRCGQVNPSPQHSSRYSDGNNDNERRSHHSSRHRGYSDAAAINDDTNNMNRSVASNVTNAQSVDASTSSELDEFGRVKSIQPKKIRWPLCFEAHGSVFVLDTRSGMFYESVSDFFYDPKSKLYYGNKQGAYFQYDPVGRNFINVSENKPETKGGTGDEVVDSVEAPLPEVKKASITINLKTKSLTSSKAPKKSKKEDGTVKDKANIVIAPEEVAVPKKHAVNIEKWSERQIEIRQHENEDEFKRGGGDDNTKIVATVKGEPICLLCRRRFSSLDKLRHHEEVSNLHKENLAKQAAQPEKSVTDFTAQPPIVSSSTYVDRAEQRRQLHQVNDMNANSIRILNSDLHSIISAETNLSDTSNVAATKKINNNIGTLDESNIGHQMLQKLGWKSGNTLGRKTESSNNRDDTALRPTESSATPTIRIEQDWDRIEAVSKLSSSQRKSSLNIGKKGIGH